MIDTNTALKHCINQLQDAQVIAVDTEFLRIDTFHPKPCVLQLASDTFHGAIDLQAGLELDELFELLYSRLLVFHSARQDLEVFHCLTVELPKRIFDTQIFAHFLGFTRQVSYGNLVFDILGIHLEKAYSNFDWSIRPLPKNALKYALDDVIYLIKLYRTFERSEFYNYALEDAAELLDMSLYITDPHKSYKYLKGRGRLREAQFNTAVRLCAYRERVASEQNKPRKWVLSDDAILHMATSGTISEEILLLLPEVPRTTLKNYEPPSSNERNEIKRYQKQFTEVATAYNLNPELFATKKEILGFMRGELTPLFAKGWRQVLLANTTS